MNDDEANITTCCPVHIKENLPFHLYNVPDYIQGEHIWSYIARLGYLNGFSNTNSFLNLICSVTYDKDWERFREWSCEMENPYMTDLVDIEGMGHWIIGATLFRALEPFNSLWEQANRIRRHAELFNRSVSKLLYVQPSYVEHIRYCPECLKADNEKGQAHYRIIHQMPGVTVCPEHGCNLLEFCGENYEVFGSEVDEYSFQLDSTTTADEYVSFCKGLVEDPVCSCMEDTKYLIISKLTNMFPNRSWKTIANKIKEDPRFAEHDEIADFLFKILTGYFDNSSSLPYELTINTLIMLFGSYQSYKENMFKMGSLEKYFMKHIKGHYTLISEYCDDFVMLRCDECGCKFPATPYSILAGLGCPECDKDMDETEILERVFKNAAGNTGWEATDPIDRIGKPMHFRNDRKCTHAFRSLGSFVYEMMTEQYQFAPYKYKIQMKNNTNAAIERVAAKNEEIERVSNGAFSLKIRSMDDEKYFVATDGTHEFMNKNFTYLCSMVERHTRAEEYEILKDVITYRIEQMIAVNGNGRIFFQDDINTDRLMDRYTSNMLTSYCKDGLIQRYDKETYYIGIGQPDITEVMTRKFFDRYGTMIGLPICNSLLDYMKNGRITDANACFAVYNPESFAGMKFIDRSVNNVGIKILYVKDVPEQVNWMKQALIYSLKSFSFVLGLSEDDEDLIKEFCKRNGVKASDVASQYENRAPYFFKRVAALIEGEKNNG